MMSPDTGVRFADIALLQWGPTMPAMTRTGLLLLALSAIAAPASADAYKVFKDVTVTCTSGLTCELKMEATGGTSDPGTFSFSRRAGAGTPLDLVLSVSRLDPNSTLIVSVDGAQALDVPLSALSYDADWYEYRLPGSAATLQLLDAARNGASAEIAVSMGGKQVKATYSLSGLVAGLIFVDEAQGRLETPDALQVKGTKDTPPIKARDFTAIAEIPESIRPRFEPDGPCGFLEESRFAIAQGFEVEVGDGYSLVGLPCAEGGAYNQPYVFYSGYGDQYDPLFLPAMAEKGPTVTDMAWNIGWDQPTKVLTAFFKGRGIGDCGTYDKWELSQAGAGPSFVLLEARAKDDCDGDAAGGPENWPLLWPVGKK